MNEKATKRNRVIKDKLKDEEINQTLNFRKNVKLLKKGEVQILQRAMKYLEETLSKLPAAEEKSK